MANPQITDPETQKRLLKYLEELDKRQNRFNTTVTETDDLLSQVLNKLESQNQKSSRSLKIQEDLSKSVNKQYKDLVLNNEQLSQSEKFSSLRRKNEEAFAQIYNARLNSTEKVKELEKTISDYPKKIIESLQTQRNLQSEIEKLKLESAKNGKLGITEEGSALDLAQKRLKSLQDQAEEMVKHRDTTYQTLNLEKEALETSKERLSTLAKETNQLKIKEQVAKAGESLLSKIKQDLNIPDFSELLTRTYDRFKAIDTATTSVRQKFGMFRNDAKGLEDQITNISGKFAKFGVDADTVGKTMETLGSEFSYLTSRSGELVGDISLLNKQFGISSEISAKFLKVMGGVSGKSAEAKKNMLAFAGASARAYGVGLQDVMNDVATSSDQARMFAGRNADEMVRAAAQARQMGTTLNNMAATSEKLLDFESSIEAELKASALLGRNINLNEIRRLSFQGKTVEANKKIVELAKQVKFNQLDPIRQKAFADAMGKSVSELMDMTEAQDRLNDALKSQDPQVRKLAQAKLEEQRLLKDNKALSQKKFEDDLKSKANQERMVQLQNELNAAIQETMLPALKSMRAVADGMVGAFNALQIDKLMSPLTKVTGMIGGFGPMLGKAFEGVKGFGKTIGDSLGNIKIGAKLKTAFDSVTSLAKGSFDKIGKMFSKIFEGTQMGSSIEKVIGKLVVSINRLKGSFDKVAKFMSTVFNNLKIGAKLESSINSIIQLSKTLGKVFEPILKMFRGLKLGGKFIPALGQALTILDALWKSVEKLTEIFSDENLNIGQKITRSLVEVPIAIVKSIIDPFLEVGRIVGELLLGKKIVDGIASVKNDIFNFVTAPFKDAYNFVLDLLGGKSPSKLGIAIVKGIEAIGNDIIQLITTPFKNAVTQVKSYFDFDLLSKFKGLGSDITKTIVQPFEDGVAKISNFFNFDILGGFDNIESELEKVLVDPFDKTIDSIKKLLTFDLKVSFPNIVSKLKTSLITPFQQSIGNVKKLLNFDLTSGFKNINEKLDTGLIKPFDTAINTIKSFLTFDLTNSFANIDTILKSVLVNPFSNSIELIKSILNFDLSNNFANIGSILNSKLIEPFGTAVKSVKSILNFDLTAGFKNIGSKLKTILVEPFNTTVDEIKSILNFDLTGGFKNIGNKLNTVLTKPFDTSVNTIKEHLNFDLSAGFKNVESTLKKTLIDPFFNAISVIKSFFSFDLNKSFKNISSMLKSTLITPFATAVKSVKSLLIFDPTSGFNNISSTLESILITPFATAVETVKSLLTFDLASSFNNISASLRSTLITPFAAAVESVKALLSFDLTAGFDNISSSLKATLITPFATAVESVKALLSFDLTKGFGNISSALKATLIIPFATAVKSVKSLLSFDLTAGFKNIGSKLKSILITPFDKTADIVKSIPFAENINTVYKSVTSKISDIVTYIQTSFNDAGDFLKTVFINPFSVVYTQFEESAGIIKTSFVSIIAGFGPILLNNIKSLGEPITKLIVYPFQTGFDMIKTGLVSVTNNFGDVITNSFNNITTGLELIFNKIKGIAAFITEIATAGINFVGKVASTVSVDTGEKGKVSAVAPVIDTDVIVEAIVSSNRVIASKLDKLTEMMSSGKIAVYVDGQRVNQALAASTVKFGSFGQATTI